MENNHYNSNVRSHLVCPRPFGSKQTEITVQRGDQTNKRPFFIRPRPIYGPNLARVCAGAEACDVCPCPLPGPPVGGTYDILPSPSIPNTIRPHRCHPLPAAAPRPPLTSTYSPTSTSHLRHILDALVASSRRCWCQGSHGRQH